MIFWLDAQLLPALAKFLTEEFDLESVSLRELGMRNADDIEVFEKARDEKVTIISKDSDFVELVQRLGPPPQLLWVTCGNVTNKHVRQIFTKLLPDALTLLGQGEAIVEIGDLDAA